MDAGLLAQYIMNGLMLGMMYALVAVGFTLFFGVLDVIKFSHGDVLTVGAFAYAAMALILDSIEKVGPDRKKIIDELANVKDRDSIVGKITFDDHGQNTVPVITTYVVQDGKFVEWADSEYAGGKRKLPGQK